MRSRLCHPISWRVAAVAVATTSALFVGCSEPPDDSEGTSATAEALRPLYEGIPDEVFQRALCRTQGIHEADLTGASDDALRRAGTRRRWGRAAC